MSAVRGILEAAFFAEKGLLPVGGGTDDQAAACMDGIRCAWAAKREIETRLSAGKGDL